MPIMQKLSRNLKTFIFFYSFILEILAFFYNFDKASRLKKKKKLHLEKNHIFFN